MEVQVQRSYTICGHGDDDPRQVIPLTIFDRFACDIHIAVVYFFTPPTPSNEAMIAGLSTALSYFPTLTGQLGRDPRGRPSLLVGGAGGGALVVEATVASSLAEHLPLEPSPELLRLHPPTPGAAHLLQVQLNRFRCGGLALGLVAHHRAADAQSMRAFMVAWTQAVSGTAVDPLPLYDQSWLRPRTPPRCEFQHWGFDFAAPSHEQNGLAAAAAAAGANKNSVDPSRITNVLLHYSSEFISSKLKSAMKARYTTFETLLAHLWRKMTVARGLGGGEETMVRITVNGRPRLHPPVSDRFFGNLVLNAYPRTTAKQLTEAGGLEAAAAIVHDAIKTTNGDYVQSMVDFGEMHGEEELVPVYSNEGNVLSPIVDAESWLRFRFEELDFGAEGKLCGLLPTWVPLEGLVIFMPAFGEADGVDVMVSLLEEDAKVLKKISHSLD